MNKKFNSMINALFYFKENLFLDLLVGAVGFVIGIIVVFLIDWKVGFDTVFPFGTWMAVIMLGVFTIFMGMVAFARQFNIAIGMGCVRKRFLCAYFATTIFFMFVDMLFLYLCFRFEKALYQMAFPEIPWVINKDIFLSPLVIFLILFVMLVIKYGCGMIVLHFGRKGIYILLFIYMAITLGGSRIAVLLTENANGISGQIVHGILDFVSNFGANIWYFIGYLICAGLLGLGIHAGLKEEVRQI